MRIFSNSFALVFVYDITMRETFDYVKSAIGNIKEINTDLQLVLVGNKLDLDTKEDKNSSRRVPFGDGLKLAMKHGMAFYEVSAKSGRNASKVFDTLVACMFDNIDKQDILIKTTTNNRNLTNVRNITNSNCCWF